ncbi:MAG TPA: SusC/RagA family TonB-linked outer membrane protein [Longimicrobiaceae bacterium]|nr:SusC/RagA family TonB-linked outer membrane protein [Longimicrobiaceae bacterium]
MHQSRLRRTIGAALLLCAGLLAGTEAQAQGTPYTIQGTVVDASAQPVAGVTVTLRAASFRAAQIRTVTDQQGRYTLAAPVDPGSYTLAFSALGRSDVTRQLTLGADRAVQVAPVTLEAGVVELEGIVVTGAGVATERRQVGNTVASVSGEAVNQAPAATSVDKALQGKITGAEITQNSGQPGGGVSIRLRGTSSILGGSDPLIVIDGVIVDNNSDALISIGANAGRQGAALSNRLSDIAPGDVERIEVLKGAAAAALYGSRANNGVIQIFTRRGRQGKPQISFRTEASVSEAPERYDLIMLPRAGAGDVAAGLAKKVGDPVERFDIQDQIFRTGRGTTNQLSVSGGNEGTSYYLSGSWVDDQGVLRATDHSKINGRAKITQRISDLLEVGVNASYVQSRTNYIPEGEQTQGVLTSVIFTPTSFNPAFDPNQGRFPYNPLLGANPLAVLQDFRADQNVDRFIGSFQATLSPLSNLTINYLFGLDDAREENTYLQPTFSTGPNFSGSIQNPIRFARKYNNDLTANYELDVSPALQLTSTAGFRHTSDRDNVIRAGATDLNVGQTVVGGATQFASQGITEFTTVGGFLQERLGIGDRLFLTGGLNVEASSAFGEDERWQLFPRLGASYVVDRESFWSNSPISGIVSTLRLRAAYGQTGGQPPGAYTRFNNTFNTSYAGRPGRLPSSTLGNPNLRPERQREIEAGFDAGFFGDRASLEFTFYDQETDNLVLGAPLPLSAGYATQFQNIGVLTNRGVEISLSTVNLQRDAFGWSSRLTYSANRNRVEQLQTSADTLVVGYLNAVVEGHPVGVFYGGYYVRNPDGSIKYDAAGLPVRARDPRTNRFANKIIGDPSPDFTAALSNSLTLGDNVELSVLFDGRFGNDVANFSRRISEFFGSAKVVEREITGDTVAGTFARNSTRINLYEEYIEDGSFVKLREVALRFRFPAAWARRMRAEDADIRVAGRNLYTWTDYSGLDPEINLFSASTVARGVDFATTPIPRSVAVGLNLTF